MYNLKKNIYIYIYLYFSNFFSHISKVFQFKSRPSDLILRYYKVCLFNIKRGYCPLIVFFSELRYDSDDV